MKFFIVLICLIHSGFSFGQSTFIDSIRQTVNKLSGKAKIEKLYKLANEHTDINLVEAIEIAKEGVRNCSAFNDDELVFKGYILMGNLSLDISNFTAADSLFNKAKMLAEKTGDRSMMLKTKDAQAKYLSFTGKRVESNLLNDEIMLLAEELNDSLIWARSYLSKGINYEKLNAFDLAIQNYYKAMRFYEALGDQFRIGIIHTNVGMALMRLKRFAESLAEFEIAANISKEIDDKEGVLINNINIGVIHQKTGNPQKAKEVFEKALLNAHAIGSWYDIALVTGNLGTVAMAQKRFGDALSLLNRAYTIKDSIGFKQEIPHTLNSIAEVNYHIKNYDTAIEKAYEANRVAAGFKNREQLAQSHRILSETYAAKNNFKLAYDHMVKYKAISDSIYTEESDKAISNLKIQYETTAKENQITELTTENKRRKTTQLIYAGLGIMILMTGASLIYALYTRRNRDKLLYAKEKELHELQSRFFANISHEFRTPLTLILGPLHNLRRQFKNTKEDSLLRTIQKSAERLLQLINQILDLTKFDMNVLELKKEIFDASNLIRGVSSSFDSLAESRDIHFSYDVDDDLILDADKRRIEIVLTNLISNAFKFTPDHGSIFITAGINESAFYMKVKDSGVGIDEENLSRIFDRYFHDDREAHSDFEGAGIGLALSRHIIEMHNGNISVSSKRNEGSEFLVSLPYVQGLKLQHREIIDGEVDEEIQLVTAIPSKASSGERPIVLLVEDRKDMRDYIVSLLQDTYHVFESSNATDGFAKAKEHVPDIIISDVMMPGKSGLELCKELKTDIHTSHIPVLLLTARSSPEDRISGLETEADIYLTKPFIPQELELHLRNLIASRQKIKEFYTHHRRIEPSKMSFNSMDEQFLESFVGHLEKHYAEEAFSVEQLADLMNMSRSQLHRKLIALTGQAPNRLIRTYRLKKAYGMVESDAATIGEISFSVGFGSPAYFTKCFVEEFGATPGDIRNRVINIK